MDMGLIRQKWESTDGIASQQMELRKIKGSGDGERNQRGKKEKTGRPRAICGQRYPLPCFA